MDSHHTVHLSGVLPGLYPLMALSQPVSAPFQRILHSLFLFRSHSLASCRQIQQILSTGWESSWLLTEVCVHVLGLLSHCCFILSPHAVIKGQGLLATFTFSKKYFNYDALLFDTQVLWWSSVSHPLSPQASSCSCWLVQRSSRWETLPRTELSSTELRNVGLLFLELVSSLPRPQSWN